MMKKAVVFLCKQPSKETLLFAEEIGKYTSFNVVVIVDDVEYELPYSSGSYSPYTVEDQTCKGYYYTGCNISKGNTHIDKDVIAWDKFLFVFCEALTSYDFAWVFEDDVFIPSIDTIINLDKKYGQYDLVTPNNYAKTDNAMDWHWPHIFKSISGPYYYSMVSAMGISRKLLDKVKQHKEKAGKLFHIEAMFNTIAMQNKLKVIDPLELKSVVWMGEWGINEFLLLPDNVFHPKKETAEHPTYRDHIKYNRKIGLKPVNMLPQFILDKM